jgi:hypothetical protein
MDGKLDFTVNSGYISISDIGHPRDFKFDVWNISARKGSWICEAHTKTFADYGKRICEVIFRHTEETVKPNDASMVHVGDVCVDYGVCVICDSSEYEEAELDSQPFLWTKEGNMVLMSSGFGADIYKVKVNRSVEATWISIVFINDRILERVEKLLIRENADAETKRTVILTRTMTFYMLGRITL